MLCARQFGRRRTVDKLGFLSRVAWQWNWSSQSPHMQEPETEGESWKGCSWGKAFSAAHRNLRRVGKGRWLSPTYMKFSQPERPQAFWWPVPLSLPCSQGCYMCLLFPLLLALVLPILSLSPPAQPTIAHRTFIPKHSPILCRAIHRVIQIPALVRELRHWHSEGTWIKSLFSIPANRQDHTPHK